MTLKKLFLSSAISVSLLAGHAVAQSAPVTVDTLANPAEGDWPAYGRASDNYRHSPLTDITPDNVNTLTLAWARGLESGMMQGQALVYDGVMYIPNPGDVIQAVDAVTGDLIWEHRRAVGDTTLLSSLGDRKRGIALFEDKVYYTTWDNFLVALDMESGQVVFEVDRGQGDDLVTNPQGPIVAGGVIVAGSSCQFSPFGCVVTGHDAATGEELWRNHLIPQPGEEGDETWGGSDYDARWMTGVWGQITYDPVLDLVHYGSTGVGPASETQRGMPGATLWGSNNRTAVRPQTGEVVWTHQVLPRDNWDQECTYEMISVNIDVNPSAEMDGLQAIGENASGERRVLTGVPCKTGTMWQFDAETGEFLWARDTVEQTIIESIDEQGIVTVNEEAVLTNVGEPYFMCPTYLGGRDWPPSAFNPNTNTYFIPLTDACVTNIAVDDEFSALDAYNVDQTQHLVEGKDTVGRVEAINVETGETLWTFERKHVIYAPIVSTETGLLFVGSADREFFALSQETGEVVWSTKLSGNATGHPFTYAVDGRQYVAIQAGDAVSLGGGYFNGLVDEAVDVASTGAAMFVFALPDA
ncbi:MAG: PQQ-binding-like beta-propeller repeat protein [Paracoccaceae bacterium]